jgi:hypothetical protein
MKPNAERKASPASGIPDARLVRLLREFCTRVHLDVPVDLGKGWGVEVNDVLFFLIHKKAVAPDSLFVDCVFGDIPLAGKEQVYRFLLDANQFLLHNQRAGFATTRNSNQVIFTAQYHLDEIDGKGLYSILTRLSDKVKAWRVDYFLKADTKSKVHSVQARLMRRP